MIRRSVPKLFTMISVGLVAGCGSSSSTPGSGGTSNSPQDAVTCSSLDPSDCGGDPTGTWLLSSVCAQSQIPIGSSLPAACSSTVVSVTPGTGSGEASFGNGAYTTNATINLTATTELSSACLSAIGPGADASITCAAIGPASASATPGLSLTCSLQSGSCKCSGGYSNTDTASGAYTVSGNQLSLKPVSDSNNDLTPSTTTFCVRSGFLIIETPAPVSGAQPFHLVFKKQ